MTLGPIFSRCTFVVYFLVFFTTGAASYGQSVDALLNKLVDKGILTQQEASDLKTESATNFSNAYKKEMGLPDWVTGFGIYGDFRGRFEQNTAQSPAYEERDRWRYRVRLGMDVSFIDKFDVGLRLASGNPQTAGGTLVGGQPITANTDLSSLESRKFVWVDAAFARWTPISNSTWVVSGTIGKMDNPFELSNMIWDYDIDPEGGAFKIVYRPTSKHTLKAIGAFFVLDELNQTNNISVPDIDPRQDPFVYGGQFILASKWTPHIESSLGVAGFDVVNAHSLSALVQPFYNSGNTRNGSGELVYHYVPLIGTASLTYKFSSFPLYAGEFPVTVGGEYMHNTGAPVNNEAYRVGVTLGKSGRKHTWQIFYRYQELQADAWFDALVDDDNGAFYAQGNPQLFGTGKLEGWFGGTNVRGHWLAATYSATDYLDLSFNYYNNRLIINSPTDVSGATHFMVDLMWRF